MAASGYRNTMFLILSFRGIAEEPCVFNTYKILRFALDDKLGLFRWSQAAMWLPYYILS